MGQSSIFYKGMCVHALWYVGMDNLVCNRVIPQLLDPTVFLMLTIYPSYEYANSLSHGQILDSK